MFWFNRCKGIAFICLISLLISRMVVNVPECIPQPIVPGYYGNLPGSLPTPAVNTLPHVRQIHPGATLSQIADNELVVRQNQEKVIIDWESFNIGPNARTHFDQKGNSHWAALNRIHDQNPSQILGRLSADGKIYLINQNGILFGPNSRISVHALIASTLGISDDHFEAGLMRFCAGDGCFDDDVVDMEDDMETDAEMDTVLDAAVSNHGTIETDEFGSVFLFGPNVENSGSINAPQGRIMLSAASRVDLSEEITAQGTVIEHLDYDEAGRAENFQTGRLTAKAGEIGMYGNIVNQEGIIRAVTAVKHNGKIVLRASDAVRTGAESITACPISESAEKVHDSFTTDKGEIEITAENIVEHRGIVAAPNGNINISAGKRVYLESNSMIDASGSWADRAVEAGRVTVKLNSVQLSDDYGQKDGVLKGEEISVPKNTGSAIGTTHDALKNEESNSLERNTAGGNITIDAGSGSIIVKKDAKIDISGGGYRYREGYSDTTRLRSGNKIYSITEAPQFLKYDGVAGKYEKNHSRYGITETCEGLYYGGVAPLRDYVGAYVQGSDAGSLKLYAGNVVYDGELYAHATAGLYQTRDEEITEEFDGRVYNVTEGLKKPEGGRLSIGKVNTPDFKGRQYKDPVIDEIVILPDVSAVEDFDANSVLSDYTVLSNADPLSFLSPYTSGEEPRYTTYLSSTMLSAAGLNEIRLNSRSGITLTEGADIVLDPGGLFSAGARTISVQGEISVPGGSVILETARNRTSEAEANPIYIAESLLGPERIYLDGGSRIDVSGECIDNSYAANIGLDIRHGLLSGGEVTLADNNRTGEGVVLQNGAVIDVQGGYEISETGEITGGDAGTVNMNGHALVLDGTLLGHSIPGSKGGKIDLHTTSITVVPDGPGSRLAEDFSRMEYLPGDLADLLLDDNRFDSSGFTDITLGSLYDTIIDTSVSLSVSLEKLANPMPNMGIDGVAIRNRANQHIVVARDYIGDTGLTLKAGQSFKDSDLINSPSAMVKTAPQSIVETAPRGRIAIEAPAVEIAGELRAPAGQIDVTSTSSLSRLTLQETARLLATGYNLPGRDAAMPGQMVDYTPLDGGTISLTAQGTLVTQDGSLVDVSGAEETYIYLENENEIKTKHIIASDAGHISLSFLKTMDDMGENLLNGELRAQCADLPGVRGGELSIIKTDLTTGLDFTDFTKGEPRDCLMTAGFEAFSFKSRVSILFDGDLDFDFGRRLELDAPILVTGAADDNVNLRADWITIANTYDHSREAEEGEGRIAFDADFIDIIGDVALSGFKTVELTAERDIRLSDYYYNLQGSLYGWYGRLSTMGDMTLDTTRTYPINRSKFTIHSGGKVTTKWNKRAWDEPVYSADGTLIVMAEDIEHNGILMAPMGEILLNVPLEADAEDEQPPRIYLGDESVLSIASRDAVIYGMFDSEGIVWRMRDKDSTQSEMTTVERVPERSIQIQGNTVISRDGAVVDVSGGGMLFTYAFRPGIEGRFDPLKQPDRYIILPGNPDAIPGDAVYFDKNELLEKGTYALMPEWHAFTPGAMIIEDLGPVTGLRNAMVSESGDPVVVGYMALSNGEHSPIPHAYLLRTAEAVLAEGDFIRGSMVAGNGGTLSVMGNTNIMEAQIVGDALPGYKGGSIALSGTRVFISPAEMNLGPDFDFNTSLENDPELAAYIDTLFVNAAGLSGGSLGNVTLGHAEQTQQVTVMDQSELTADTVTLAARDAVHISEGSVIEAMGEGGEVALRASAGEIKIAEGALVHAENGLTLDGRDFDIAGDIQVDNSTLNLQSDAIYLVPDGYAGATEDAGLYITSELWNGFATIENVILNSRTEIAFLGAMVMSGKETITLAADEISLAGNATDAVSLDANTIYLKNSGNLTEPSHLYDDRSGTMTLEARNMTIEFAPGDEATALRFNGFEQVNIRSENELKLLGVGDLEVPGNLTMASGRMTAGVSFYYDDNGISQSQLTRVHFNAPNGNMTISGNQADSSAIVESVIGGRLMFTAQAIDYSGNIHMPGGMVLFEALSDDPLIGIFIHDAKIDLSGTRYAGFTDPDGDLELAQKLVDVPGGTLLMETLHGRLQIDASAQIDVSSAGETGDAGEIIVHAPDVAAVIEGTISGHAADGKGGSFYMDTQTIADADALTQNLQQAGFDGDVSLRARYGDISSNGFSASNVSLTADAGSLSINGRVVANGDKDGGGDIELQAATDVTLTSESRLEAAGEGEHGDGGSVFISAENGEIRFDDGGGIYVSGSGTGNDGSVVFRTRRSETDGDIPMRLNGSVTGAAYVAAEIVQTYQPDAAETPFTIDAAFIADRSNDIAAFRMDAESTNAADSLSVGLTFLDRGGVQTSGDPAFFYLIPGIEIQYDGDITLAANWDFSQNPQGPGALTIRAGGNLTIGASLQDHPTAAGELLPDTALDSWRFDLVAGADLSSADPLAVKTDDLGMAEGAETGSLTIEDDVRVYSESGALRFASGLDTIIGLAARGDFMTDAVSVRYNLGVFDGTITGNVGRDLIVDGGAIQAASGDIDIHVGNDMYLNFRRDIDMLGSIRTLGVAPLTENEVYSRRGERYWEYHSGGNIVLDVMGDIDGTPRAGRRDDNSGILITRWDMETEVYDLETDSDYTVWSANYANDDPTQGIAAMAGGDVSIRAREDVICPAGTFGDGDLSVYAGGDLNGRFLVNDGNGTLFASESSGTRMESQLIELFDATLTLNAQGDIRLGKVTNARLANDIVRNTIDINTEKMAYSEDTGVSLISYYGDVSLTGENTFYGNGSFSNVIKDTLPADIAILAGKSIYLDLIETPYLAPSAEGNLRLIAGLDIDGSQIDSSGNMDLSGFRMADCDPEKVYGDEGDLSNLSTHASDILHKDDPYPVVIQAGRDIKGVSVESSKPGRISAGRDIYNMRYNGQNLDPDDITSIYAANNIFFSSQAGMAAGQNLNRPDMPGIDIGGPGYLLVQAGGEIDLGTTSGIRTIGGLKNPSLGTQGSDLDIIAGFSGTLTPEDIYNGITDFFTQQKRDSEAYTRLLNEYEYGRADQLIAAAEERIADFCGDASGSGDIKMIRSQISTTSNGTINIISSGQIDVGESTISSNVNDIASGINTEAGGDVNLLINGDINVNEARLMTWFGGDISLWSRYGDINAGRGSTTAVNASKRVTYRDTDGTIKEKREAAAVGSGVRTLTFDPDGNEGPQTAPLAGDVYMCAPSGVIDAGEAGIKGRNIFLGAPKVLNVQNISFSQGAVGVPVPVDSSVNVAALTGTGTMTGGTQVANPQETLKNINKQLEETTKMMEDVFMPTWLRVEFIGFDVEDE